MQYVKSTVSLALGLLVAATPALARDTIDSFSANGKSYEVYVGYGDSVYVTYAGNTDTKYVKASGSNGCQWKKTTSGRCVSESEMLSDIRANVEGKRY